MRKHGFNLGYFIREGFASIFSHGLMSFAAVCMIVACLLIMGSFSLLAVNADNLLSEAEDDNEFLVFIDETYTDDQINELGAKIMALPNVDAANVRFIPKEEAKATYIERYGDDTMYASLPDEVFRDRISIHVLDLSKFKETVEAVKALEGAANVRDQSELAMSFVAVRNGATALATVLVGLLVCVSLFIIANTIRLAAFTRKEEIAIMKMCGATDGFVRWPFIIEGLVLGITGAIVAFFLQWGVYTLVLNGLEQSGVFSIFVPIPFLEIWKMVLLVFCGAGALIGMVGSGLAIGKFLQV